MMVIKPESSLSHRDLRVHEAGHFVVGVALGLPMEIPEIFADGSGGRAPFDHSEAQRRAATPLPILTDNGLEKVERCAALNIAATFLAGYCAEAIAAGDNPRCLFGSRTRDMANAGQVLLMKYEHDGYLQIAWNRAWSVLTEAWPHVLEIAELIPVTQGTHPPEARFLS